LKVIALVYPTFSDRQALIGEVHERVHAFADTVVVSEQLLARNSWAQMEAEADPQRGDYVFVLEDTDYIDDVEPISRWLKLNSEVAYACMRFNMYTGNEYRMDGHYKPRLMYQLFPYKPKASLHKEGLPTYSYSMPYIMEPHLTVLSFRNYEKPTRHTVTTKRWENPIPQTAAETESS
jgi:hypothetical protein